ncbi:hypothetical protein H4R99_002504 [Coemansia sp. RSA 1722]|nr:hypothetical protein LPJ57_006677 [Coemansia sp. RSA 486]KAJ2223757.1 hypothetical protein IWW45_008263 [Coemansia sp. RSA 485]KAJ2599725.1 hypothetical protein GGF39_002105 [Coemansia sp. RSA 1721]KAJ2602994.1 hypothetical protein H4R99_002504 [Coemansia sp. RSA 1722]KAJ2637715.1 hypothetical protein GGF40_002174 [Coemansia sp. RSA 1286]
MVRAAGSGSRRSVISDGMQVTNWYNSMGIITKTLFTSVVTCTLFVSLGVVPGYYMGLYWPSIWNGFQVWRLVTGFLTTHVSLNEAIMLAALYFYSTDLETQEFGGRTADYAWFIMFSMIAMASVAWITFTSFLYHGLFLALLTMWSLHRQQQIVNFFMGIKIPAQYLPYATITLWFLIKRGKVYAILDMVYGFGAAHLYYYLSVDLPSQGSPNYIPTPQLVYRFFGQPQQVRANGASGSNSINERPGGGHYWGASGRTLG